MVSDKKTKLERELERRWLKDESALGMRRAVEADREADRKFEKLCKELKQLELSEPDGNARTHDTTEEKIMQTVAFRRGVAEVRAGQPPRFDEESKLSSDWSYERGRQFAIVAPRDLQIVLPKKRQLNPKAVALYRRLRDII
jgi:hypothetical protein